MEWKPSPEFADAKTNFNRFWILSCIKIDRTQLICRGTPRGYPRIEELILLTTGARSEILNLRAPSIPLYGFTPRSNSQDPLISKGDSYAIE
jgi:hypothetical protein